MDVGDRVVWNHSRLGSDDEGWAGPGFGKILQLDAARPGFGQQSRQNPQAKGVAALIQLDHNDLRQWVHPNELDALRRDGDAS